MEDLEELRKQQILQTAMAVFIEKGYFAASMKDIADACGMAKGSIYKIFPSKEDLFTAVFVHVHRKMLEEARALDEHHSEHSAKERLCRKIAFQLQHTLENYYFASEFKELPITHNENFIVAWKKKRSALLTWHRECFDEAYGDVIGLYIWDIVAIYRGIMKEYAGYAIQKAVSLPMAELASFIAERMDAIVKDMLARQPKPVLNAVNIYTNHINPADPETQKQTLFEYLDSFSRKIEQLDLTNKEREQLLEVFALLRQELMKTEPNPTLLRVYENFLERNAELQSYVKQLQVMI
ncbi:TetR/AcrR family transcriptional regulator [Paenibacillus sp. HB172176]|uniref:TetR/AcrR family transcriptional regulator n=1 Tax=Paenibacillus sp. HB172176 TaxID=2493690 RepID=UPI00143BCC08|nr:TetR/AcrR family transcriptional regulator [Paenibacillus sp. HB172176]